MTGRWQAEDGTASTMVAVLAVALLACAGLAYDGGAIITAHAASRDVAAGAARAGAQQLAPAAVHHDATARLDPVAATVAARAFLTAAHARGSVTVAGPSVTVTVTANRPMRLLPLPDRRITATATATAVSDVLGAGP